jgi:integrase
MPRKVSNQLHVKQLDGLPPGLHADGGGLYLQIGPNSKSWVFRYMLQGNRRDMGLGPYPERSLARARDLAFAARQKVLDKVDPIDARLRERGIEAKAKIRRQTFKQVAEAYIEEHEAGWRNEKHKYQWRQSLASYAYPVIGDLVIGQVDTDAVLNVLRPIWATKTETASRLRGRIETVIGAATAAKLRDGENPASWSILRHMLAAPKKIAKVEHHAAAAIDDMPKIMCAIRAVDTMASKALQFAILCASRTSEVTGATWPEIDMDARLWVVPGERMKSGRAHRVPLSDGAMAILRELATVAEPNGYVFHGQRAGKPLSNMALIMLLRRVGLGELTTHGFRSTFKDWAAERTNVPSEVSEMALAHVVGDKVEAAYRRGDLLEKRRELADSWAAHCS